MPDEALARVYDVVPQEIARRRAAAIERLADELGAQRGEDLGAVLQALLDEGTWTAGEVSTNGEPEAALDEAVEEEEEEEAEAPVVPVPSEPVLEMLAAREGVRGPDADEPGEEGARRGVVAIAVASFVAAVIGGAAAFVGLSQWDGGGHGGGTASAQPPNEGMQHFVPQLGGPFEAPFPSDPEPLSCFSVASTTG